MSHLKNYELIKEVTTVTLKKYLESHPETIIATAYFDFGIYEPTKNCLGLIKNHITRGSIIRFDELNDPSFPGETLALQEVFGLVKNSIRQSALDPRPSVIVID